MSTIHSYAVARPTTPYSSRGEAVVGSPIDASLSVLAATPRPIISFAMGSPAADAIPAGLVSGHLERVLGSDGGAAALDYTPTEGAGVFRDPLLVRLSAQSLDLDPSCLLTTAGGMQGLDLVFKLFTSPGDLVIAESPSYANGVATAKNYGAEVVQIPVDAEGMDLEQAEAAVRLAGRNPRVIYSIPTFQNPSGVTYSLARRTKLLELARTWKALIIEDDPYSELRYDGEPVPSLLELDASRGTVIQVRTFSKIIAPGLRLGWVVAPADTVTKMAAAKQSMDTCANSMAQYVVAEMLRSGDVDTHVSRLKAIYPRRRDAMLAALERECRADGVSWTRPAGGMFIWLALPEWLDGDDLLAAGMREGVAVVPGSAFDPVRCRNAVRLCFTAADEDRINRGVEDLGRAIRHMVSAHEGRSSAAVA